MAQELVVSIQKSMMNMDWVFVNDYSLCSIKDANAALKDKPWMIDRWMKQQKLRNYTREEFEEKLSMALEQFDGKGKNSK